jgi:hypothetical protein
MEILLFKMADFSLFVSEDRFMEYFEMLKQMIKVKPIKKEIHFECNFNIKKKGELGGRKSPSSNKSSETIDTDSEIEIKQIT